MTEINTQLLDYNDIKSANNEQTFNKLNAWKNEWEKAQIKDVNTENKKSEINISTPNKITLSDIGLTINRATHLDIIDLPTRSVFRVVNQAGDKSQSLTSSSNGVYSSVLQSTLIDQSELPGMQLAKPNLYTGNNLKFKGDEPPLLNKIEYIFGTKYKPQNLSLVINENGVKLLLRDYRLDRQNLDKIVSEISGYLNDYGFKIIETVINGIGEK